MYLKGLTMQGFKSFADKITLDFSNGITAIVGPNGSGKSNINDAVRWVMGEQSAKSLRGSKMEDVIFAGTQKRSPLGFAEVTLILDNTDKTFNIAFDEVSVTRRVYASGESAYLINNAPCRLRDIHEIFMDTGLGRDGYSMIGQGKIDEILSTKSEDRRQIFEEAAGISKYRYRKEDAERKLKNTEENLSRVLDITVELESQLEPLLKQSEKAKKYLVLKEELKTFEVNNAISVITKSKEELSGIEQKLSVAQKQLDDAKADLLKTENEQGEYYRKAKEYEEQVSSLQEKLNSTNSEITLQKGEIDVFKNTIDGNEKLKERIRSEIKELGEKKLAYVTERQETKKKIEEKNEKLSLLDKEIEKLNEEVLGLSEGAGEQNSDIDKLKDEVVSKMNTISDFKIKLSNSDIIKQNLNAKLSELKESAKEREVDFEKSKTRLSELQKNYDDKEKFVENVLLKVRQGEEALKEQNTVVADKKAELNRLLMSANEKRSKINLLKQMEQNLEGYAKSVKEIMKAKDTASLKNAKIIGPVSKLISVSDKYIQAIEAAIGGAMQNIVTESEEDAKIAINYLKENRLGRATFMPVSAMRGSLLDDKNLTGEQGFINIASRLVDYDERFSGVVNSLLGKIAVVDTIDNGIKMSRKFKSSFRIVTLTGDVFNVGGSMSGGSAANRGGVMGRESEIKQLEKEMASISNDISKLQNEIKELETTLKESEEKVLDDRDIYLENKEVLIVLDKDISHIKEILDGFAEKEEKLKSEEKQIFDLIAKCDDEKKEISEKTEAVQKEIDALRQEINKLEEDFEAVMYKKEEIADKIVELNIEKNVLLKDIETDNEKIENLEREAQFADTSLSLRYAEQKDVESKNKELEENISDFKKQIEENTKLCETLKAQIEEMRQTRGNLEQKSLDAQSLVKKKNDEVHNLSNEYMRIENKKTKLDVELDNVISKLWEDYELTFTTALEYKKDLSGENVPAKITSLKNSIRALGNVNVDAIEEYKSVKERFDFLSGQKNDLEEAKTNLLKIISEMTDVMKVKFREEFARISENFKQTFVELFGGGRASLTLDDETNILECGINIDVQPPGKKLQSLSLLSGGERAFSAIALLFAIFKTRPTPFCFLDEIEAALDDVNVYRFADYVKTYTGKTQFIIVTHRRGTMESADVIYGVTMQEKGVSKLLKLDINEVTG